ncbi:sensor histidine kinase KdpD [Bacillus sp. FJAT-22090]|uniref:sensor histidine kinase n=1 Tax=Bacillus sp. FJAT-22090 TaxID=1581038 RepID=UPI0011A11505|nr:HAMP domain-containing sensor histidine kinase [Bacillus sp. FJAT-22090]
MLYITILSIVIVLLLFTRLFFVKKEIKKMTNQLKQKNRKINLSFFDKDIEKLAKEINEQIDLTNTANAEKKRTENELKQAVSNISHDIRTPMTSILGYVQFLELEDITSKERASYTAIVKNGALRLKVLLEDFFELSIVESTEYPLKIERVTLNNLVLEVLVGFYEEFRQKGIEPIIELPQQDIKIKADVSAVKRVIENLLINTIHHSEGNVVLRIEQLANFVQLTISNPAPQLLEIDVAHLFDRFYKADQTRTGKGTGLGLSIAKSLMLKMNGSLSGELKEHQLVMICKWKSE